MYTVHASDVQGCGGAVRCGASASAYVSASASVYGAYQRCAVMRMLSDAAGTRMTGASDDSAPELKNSMQHASVLCRQSRHWSA